MAQASAPGAPHEWAGHEVLYAIAEAEGNVTEIEVTARFSASVAGMIIYLYIWRDSTGAWVELDNQDIGASIGTKFTLSGNITVDEADYIDVGGNVSTLVAQLTGDPANIVNLFYQELVVSS